MKFHKTLAAFILVKLEFKMPKMRRLKCQKEVFKTTIIWHFKAKIWHLKCHKRHKFNLYEMDPRLVGSRLIKHFLFGLVIIGGRYLNVDSCPLRLHVMTSSEKVMSAKWSSGLISFRIVFIAFWVWSSFLPCMLLI